MTMPALVPMGAYTGKPPIPLRRPVLLIGSRNIAHLHLLSRKVSKAHALIINSDGRIFIRDLASRTHVFVNGEQIRQANLKNGDQIKIGSFTFRLTIPPNWQTRPRDNPAQPAQLNVEGAEMPVRLDERVTLIGRRPICDVSLLEESASTAHAVIFEMGGRRFIRDLGSRTGTFINGRQIHQQELDFGDVIRIGETDFSFSPASEISAGPIPADELDADFDELEDLVGTAPLMEEPPEVIAKRLEGEHLHAASPAEPAPEASEASAAPVPLDIEGELDLESEPEFVAPRNTVPSVSATPEDDAVAEDSESEAADSDEVETGQAEIDGAEIDTAEAEAAEPEILETDLPAHDAIDETVDSAESVTDDQTAPLDVLNLAPESADQQSAEPAEALSTEPSELITEETAPEPVTAGIDDLDLLDVAAPATESELDLAEDLELEAEPEAADPEATHALPPDRKHKPRQPPVISEAIVDEPVTPLPDAETDADAPIETTVGSASADRLSETAADDENITDTETDDLTIPLDLEVDEPIDDPAGDTVALAAQATSTEMADDGTESDSETESPAIDEQPAFEDEKIASEGDIEDEIEVEIEPEIEAPVDEQTDVEPDEDELTLEPTAPTPESAQSLEPELEALTDEHPDLDELTDTGFDREIHAFAEDSAEPIDEPEETGADEPISQAPEKQPDLALEAEQFAEVDLGLSPAKEDAAELPPLEDDVETEVEAIEAEVEAIETAVEAGEESEDDSQSPAAEAPDQTPPPVPDDNRKESFSHGVNQWGFLGGTALVLGDIPQPPPPARGGRATPRPPHEMPFGKQPLPVDDLHIREGDADEYADPFNDQSGPLPQIDEVDVFSQLGAPPDDDPFFGTAALGHARVSATSEPQIPPTTQNQADAEASPEIAPEPADPVNHDDTDPQWADHPADAASDDPFGDLQIEDAQASDHADDSDDSDDSNPPPQAKRDPARNAARRPAIVFEEPQAPRRKRRWFFSVPLLFALMLLSATGAAAAIWYTVPVAAVVTGSLPFQNLKGKSTVQRNLFFDQQAALLADQSSGELVSTRERAKAKLREHYGNVDPGFLEDAQAYAVLVDRSRQAWLDANSDTIQLRLQSQNPTDDQQRLHALLLALFEGNRRLIDQHNNARHNADEVVANLRVAHEDITRLQVRLEELKRDGERPATPAEIAALEREIVKLEKEWRAAEEAVHEAQVQIDRMREAASRTAAAAQPNQDRSVAIEDMELRQMQEQFERLDQRLQVTAVADDLEINRTRRQMDLAISQLEEQIEQVKQQMADVPEMKGYVAVARFLQDTINQLTNELIDSQKRQLDTINVLKRKLDEQLAARRNEIWDNDPDLKNLTALLDIQRRHFNAAIAADHAPAKEAMDELAASINQLEQRIEDRRRVLGNDGIYADAIGGMEELIRTSEKRLEEDQKRAEERIALLQQQLAEAAPDLRKLPEEQKALAAELEKRLVEMSQSRKAYSEAMARAADDSDNLREVEARALALKRQIDSRRQTLLAERLEALSEQEQTEIRARIQAKTAELNALQAAARDAHKVFLNRSNHLAAVQSSVQAAVASGPKRDQIARELAEAQTRRDELTARKQQMDESLTAAIYPVEPMPADDFIQLSQPRDERPLYALIAVGGIALLFGVLMLAAHHAQTRVAPPQRVIEIEPPLFPSRDTVDDTFLASAHPESYEEPSTA